MSSYISLRAGIHFIIGLLQGYNRFVRFADRILNPRRGILEMRVEIRVGGKRRKLRLALIRS